MIYRSWEAPWKSCKQVHASGRGWLAAYAEESLCWAPRGGGGRGEVSEWCWRARGPRAHPGRLHGWRKNPALSSDLHTPKGQVRKVSCVHIETGLSLLLSYAVAKCPWDLCVMSPKHLCFNITWEDDNKSINLSHIFLLKISKQCIHFYDGQKILSVCLCLCTNKMSSFKS